jgi:hypothetical protein
MRQARKPSHASPYCKTATNITIATPAALRECVPMRQARKPSHAFPYCITAALRCTCTSPACHKVDWSRRHFFPLVRAEAIGRYA